MNYSVVLVTSSGVRLSRSFPSLDASLAFIRLFGRCPVGGVMLKRLHPSSFNGALRGVPAEGEEKNGEAGLNGGETSPAFFPLISSLFFGRCTCFPCIWIEKRICPFCGCQVRPFLGAR